MNILIKISSAHFGLPAPKNSYKDYYEIVKRIFNFDEGLTNCFVIGVSLFSRRHWQNTYKRLSDFGKESTPDLKGS